jgi:hypothetical protein
MLRSLVILEILMYKYAALQKEKLAAPQKQPLVFRIGDVIMLLTGILLLSQAEDLGRKGPWPWQHLSKAIPAWGTEQEHYFFLSIGGFLVVFALDSSPVLQTPPRWDISQCLRDLSFGIDTMHGLVIWTLHDQVLGPWRQR